MYVCWTKNGWPRTSSGRKTINMVVPILFAVVLGFVLHAGPQIPLRTEITFNADEEETIDNRTVCAVFGRCVGRVFYHPRTAR